MNPLRDPSKPLPENVLLAMHRRPALSKPTGDAQTRGWMEVIRGTNNANNHADTPIPDTKQRERTKTLAGSGEGKAQGTGRISSRSGCSRPLVSITLHRVSLLDTDAKWASVKDVLDCCWRSSLVDGDREDQITLEVRQEKVRKKTDEKTVIEVTTFAQDPNLARDKPSVVNGLEL